MTYRTRIAAIVPHVPAHVVEAWMRSEYGTLDMEETLQDTIDRACAALPTRAQYARDVIRGDQRWSGADLKGKAKKFGATYAHQRSVALRAWHDAGGVIVAVEHGRNVSAVEAGTDAQGRAVYCTVDGLAVLDPGRQNARLVPA